MPKKHSERINGSKLHVCEWEGEKGPIIGVHGLTANHASWQPLAEELSPEYKFLSYDMRSRGKSSPADEDSSVHRHSEDLIRLMDKLDIESPFLLSHSMGTYVALSAAKKNEDISGLVLMDGGVNTKDEMMDNMIIPLIEKLDETYSSEEEYIETSKQYYSVLGVEWNKYIETITENKIEKTPEGTYTPIGDPDKILNDAISVHQFDIEGICPQIKCPTLFIRASEPLGEKPLFSKEDFERPIELVPNSEYTEIEANHYTLVFEKKLKLAKTIRDFFEKISQ